MWHLPFARPRTSTGGLLTTTRLLGKTSRFPMILTKMPDKCTTGGRLGTRIGHPPVDKQGAQTRQGTRNRAPSGSGPQPGGNKNANSPYGGGGKNPGNNHPSAGNKGNAKGCQGKGKSKPPGTSPSGNGKGCGTAGAPSSGGCGHGRGSHRVDQVALSERHFLTTPDRMEVPTSRMSRMIPCMKS